MVFVSVRGITQILIGRFSMKVACLFDVYLLVSFHSMTKNLHYFKNVSVTKSIRSNYVIEFRRRWLKKPTHGKESFLEDIEGS